MRPAAASNGGMESFFADIITNPWFYAAAIPSILLIGISKGGLGGGAGTVAVPIMTLVIGPVQAAAILLPILCVMDAIGFHRYRRTWSGINLAILIPAGTIGVLTGWATAQYMSEDFIRLIIGVIAVAFTVYRFIGSRRGKSPEPTKPSVPRGMFWGIIAGFTSFVAHAGGPPKNIYLLPQKLDRSVFVGTSVMTFIILNYVKLVPYWALGQFDSSNLSTSIILLPLAPAGMALGFWMHSRVSEDLFYRIAYSLLFVAGVKLLWDGTRGLLG